MKGKRGDSSASSAAAFILMMLLFLVIYIMVLPSSEKAKLVGDEYVGYPGYSDYGDGPRVESGTGFRSLMSTSPGRVYPYLNDIVQQPLTAVRLFTDTRDNIITLADSIYTSKGFFSDKSQTLTFNLENTNIENAALYFFVINGEGRLNIKLNGAEIFNGEITNNDLPINLPVPFLRKSNRLTFESSSGLGFFGSAKYELKDIKIVMKQVEANVLEKRTFVLTDAEYKNLEGLTLFYFTNCQRIQESGTMKIYLNNKLVDQRLVVCEAGPIGQDIDLINALSGANILEFEIDRGSYVLEQIYLEKRVSQRSFPLFNFYLQPDEFYDVEDYNRGVFVRMKFLNDGYRKSAAILVNGITLYVDTYGDQFNYDISDFIVEGENFIKIIPRTEFDILNLEVDLEG